MGLSACTRTFWVSDPVVAARHYEAAPAHIYRRKIASLRWCEWDEAAAVSCCPKALTSCSAELRSSGPASESTVLGWNLFAIGSSHTRISPRITPRLFHQASPRPCRLPWQALYPRPGRPPLPDRGLSQSYYHTTRIYHDNLIGYGVHLVSTRLRPISTERICLLSFEVSTSTLKVSPLARLAAGIRQGP